MNGRRRAALLAPAAALAVALIAGGARSGAAAVAPASRLVYAHADPGKPRWLAQRTIVREWGPSDDSLYREVMVPGWKSEGGAMALSALLPGTGQLYADAGAGWAWLLGETVGWVLRATSVHRAGQLRRDAASFIGNPYDSSAAWSFARWQESSAASTAGIEALWNGDREAFYERIAGDPAYFGGYSGANPSVTLADFRDLRSRRDDMLGRVHTLEVLLWINHVVSAVDALRGAHLHNLPLAPQVDLKLGERGSPDRPEVRLAFEGRF